MEIYVFSSKDLTNIWAGIGARKWAVAETQKTHAATLTKANKIRIGSLGLLYCSENKAFTTPFIITSKPTDGSVSDIWPGTWWYPFSITPLGSPQRMIASSMMSTNLPAVARTAKPWNHILSVKPDFVFQASNIEPDDWEYIYDNLNHT